MTDTSTAGHVGLRDDERRTAGGRPGGRVPRIAPSGHEDLIAAAVHLRPPRHAEVAAERFRPTDPPRGLDLARIPLLRRALHSRRFQFALILPNQIIFWMVIFLGLLGTVVPGLNFGNAITWYLWFCLVFVMMVVVGRAWCSMCPFGGFAEWVQRRALWQRAQRALGLGRKLPEPVARYGFLLSVGTFLVLTWIEEYYNIAGPGRPEATAFMVLGIVASALLVFVLFERRTFCRYFCPLSALIGTVGAMGSVAGFRTRDREVCLSCSTKECMRGGTRGYGCPWYTWPGSADSNLACGLCSECYKGCPEENVGFYLQPPLTSIVAPRRRRADVAWAVAVLWGLVLFQQINATNGYGVVDGWLNRVTGFPAYPNPIDYFGIIAVLAVAMAGLSELIRHSLARPNISVGKVPEPSFVDRPSRFRAFFVPSMYALIPVVGADYFARQLPKFFKHVSRLIPSVGAWFGAGSTHSALYNMRLLSNPGIIAAQLVVMGLGTLAAVWTSWRIAGRELAPLSRNTLGVQAALAGLAVACGVAAGFLYVIMHAAS
jgi:NosR/NirI family nitrous oxide reductase transcriptional regulator